MSELSTQNVPTPQPFQPVSTRSNFLNVVLVAITFLLFGLAGGYYLGKTSLLDQLFAKYKSKACTMEAKICPDGTAVGRTGPNCEFAPCPTPLDSTANWKTYSNSQYGFSFKYPSNLIEEGGVGGTFTGNPQNIGILSDKSTMKEGTDAPFDGFSFYFVSNTESSLTTFLSKEISVREQSPRGIFSKIIHPITVAGMASAYLDVEESLRQYFIPAQNNKIILFSVVRQSDNFLNTFDQILSTFKFLDQGYVVGIQLSSCCSCSSKISRDLIGRDGWVIYEKGKDYSSDRPTTCGKIICAPCPPLD